MQGQDSVWGLKGKLRKWPDGMYWRGEGEQDPRLSPRGLVNINLVKKYQVPEVERQEKERVKHTRSFCSVFLEKCWHPNPFSEVLGT